MRLLFLLVAVLLGAVVCGSISYLLFILCAAYSENRRGRAKSAAARETSLHITVLIPAHNEELVLAGTLDSLAAQEYPALQYEIVVVADNCTDRTAAIARDHGVTVLERENATERGKGYALAWAFEKLLCRPEPADAFVIVDADTWVAPDFLSLLAARLVRQTDARGFCALQGRYGVLNSSDGWRAALMSGAFDLFNHIKPLGRERLGLGVGLKGNGMGFSRALIQAAPWQGSSVTEDIDYGLDLARHHGVRAGYVPEARVLAQMPATAEQASSQRERWEGGRYRLLRERALPLLFEGIRRRNLILCDAGIDLMLPPLAELGALLAVWIGVIAIGGAAHLVSHIGVWSGFALASLIGLCLYIFGGLYISGAPRETYAAMARAPIYAVWKIWLYAMRAFRKLRRGGNGSVNSDEWVRTARAPLVKTTTQSVSPSQPESSVE